MVALGLWFASPAMAAFPGANGLLAVEPVSGAGIILVGANGRNAHRICTDVQQCGTPREPRWSPDGRAIVFSGPDIRIVYADGSCMNCQFGAAADPAFEPSGSLISYSRREQIGVAGIDGVPKTSPGVRVASDAVWSADGRLAVVRRGAVWAGRPGRLHRLAPGSDPSWSPRSDRIAIDQRGWVAIVRVSNHRVQRLVRGSAPAFSPDGRWIAFVARDHRLMIVSARGGHPRPVGRIRATSVDWQPKPHRTSPGCVAPPGSTVVASTPDAIVTQDGATPSSGSGIAPPIAFMGCLRADGRERLLDLAENEIDNESTFSLAAVAAPYVAFVESPGTEAFSSPEVVRVFDLRTGALRKDLGGESASCSGAICGTLDEVLLGSDGVSAAHSQQTTGPLLTNPLGQDACAPGGTVCLAYDQRYNSIFSSTDPAAGAQSWTLGEAFAVPAPTVMTCPSQSLCVGGGQSNYIYTLIDAAGGQDTWQGTQLPGNTTAEIVGISCPTVSLCVATRDDGSVVTSMDPTGGTQAWSVTQVDTHALGAVVCSAEPRCFVTDDAGTVLTSANPNGGAGAWSVSPTTPPFLSGACPTTSFCVTVNGLQTATTTDPSAAAWTEHAVGDSLDEVSCPSPSLCVAVVRQGQLDVSTDPASGTWTPTTVDDTQALAWVSCASVSLCVATGAAGDVVVSTNPAGGPSAWSRGLLYSACVSGAGCNVESIEVSDGAGVRTVDQDQSTAPEPLLTGLALNGDTVSWSHEGSPRSVELAPPS